MDSGPASRNDASGATGAAACGRVEAAFDAAVVAAMLRCAAARPEVEDGGRLLGFLEEAPEAAAPTRLRIVALLPPGPRARRSATMLFQDGEWQDWVFDALERLAPDVRYLGSFHHHLSNGYDRFSEGDVAGYRAFLADYPQRFNAFLGVLMHRPFPGESGRFHEFLTRHCRVALITPDALTPLAPDRITVTPDDDSQGKLLREAIAVRAGGDMPWQLRRERAPFLAALREHLLRVGEPPRITLNSDQDITFTAGPYAVALRTACPGKVALRAEGKEALLDIEHFDPRTLTHGL